MDNSMISIFFSVLNLIVIIWLMYDSYRKDELIYRLQEFNEKLAKDNDSLSESIYYNRWELNRVREEVSKNKQVDLENSINDMVVEEFIKNQRPKTTSSLNDFKK